MALFNRIPGVDDTNNFNSDIRKAIANSTAAEVNTAGTNMRTEVDKRVAASTDFLKKTDATSTYLTKTDATSTYLTKTSAAETYITPAAVDTKINAIPSVESVTGAVTLPSTGGKPIRQFYTEGSTRFVSGSKSVLTAPGTTIVFRRTPAGVWGYSIADAWTNFDGGSSSSGGVYSSAFATAIMSHLPENYWPMSSWNGLTSPNFGVATGAPAIARENSSLPLLQSPGIGDGPNAIDLVNNQIVTVSAVLSGYAATTSWGFLFRMPSGTNQRGLTQNPFPVFVNAAGELTVNLVRGTPGGSGVTTQVPITVPGIRVDTNTPKFLTVSMNMDKFFVYLNGTMVGEATGGLTPPGALGFRLGIAPPSWMGGGHVAGGFLMSKSLSAGEVMTLAQAAGVA